MSKHLSALAGVLWLLGALPAFAQVEPDSDAERILSTAEQAASAPASDLATGLVNSSVTFEAASDKSEVSLTLGGRHDLDRGFGRFSAAVTTLVDKGEDEGFFFTDDDLSADTELALDYSVVVTTAREPQSTSLERRALLCRHRDACLIAAKTEAERADCHRIRYSDIRDKLSVEERARFDDPFLTAPLLLAGVKATVGYQNVDFRETSAPDVEIEDERIPWSVTLKAGLLSPDRPYYLGGGVEYAQTYKDQDSRTFCLPPSGGLQECFSGPYGTPKAQEEATLYGVARAQHAFELPWFSRSLPLALEFKPAYAFDSEVAGLATSLYFIPNKAGALTGGLRLRIQTDDNDPDTHDENVSIGLFVGAAFSLPD